jgi:transcriptional regulator with XRE-family HTH domain
MEFNEKLQTLRKQKGLTQEELAEILFVSRTAVSKWESGRGYPSIDSLKAIAKFFSVTIDELLSNDEILTIAEEDTKTKESHLRDLVFGMLDISAAMFFILPFFGQSENGSVISVSLPALTGNFRWAYMLIISSISIFGVLTLALQNYSNPLWKVNRSAISMLLSVIAVLLFIMGRQPYAAAFLFILLIIKAIMTIKPR